MQTQYGEMCERQNNVLLQKQMEDHSVVSAHITLEFGDLTQIQTDLL